MTNALVIKNGTVILPGGPEKTDVLARNGKISKISPAIRAGKARTLDATGMLVLPGVVDPHVHFKLRVSKGLATSDGFESGSMAAAAGGTTTVIDFTQQKAGESLIEGIKNRIKEAESRMFTDYSFHCVVPSPGKNRDLEKEFAEAAKMGITSFKIFTAYGERGLMSDDEDLSRVLKISARLRTLVCVHAEDEAKIKSLAGKYAGAGFPDARALSLVHPAITEWAAVKRVCEAAGPEKARVYFVHLSSGKSAEIIRRCKNPLVAAETCPQYLVLDESKLRGKNGHYFACCPPLRTKKDSHSLWRMIKNGTVRAIGTDNCAFTKTQKDAWKGDIAKLPMGIPGCQTSLPLMYTFGVIQKRIDLKKMTEIMSENPAKLMGLYPRKGVIRPGSDADFAVIDPAAETRVDWKRLQHNTDYSPYQDMALRGFPRYTVLRGEIVAEMGKIVCPKPGGRFIGRGKPLFK